MRARPRLRSSRHPARGLQPRASQGRGNAAQRGPEWFGPGKGPPCPIPQGQSPHSLQIPAQAPRTACPPHTARAWPGMSSQAHQPGPVPRPRTEAAGVQRPRDIPSAGGVGSPADSCSGKAQIPSQEALSPPSSLRGSRPLRAPAMSASKAPGTLLPPAHPLPRAGGLPPTRNVAVPSAPRPGPHTPDPAPGPHPRASLPPASSPLTRRHLSHCSRAASGLSPLPLPQGGPSPTTCCNSASLRARTSTTSTTRTAPTGSPPHASTPHAHLGTQDRPAPCGVNQPASLAPAEDQVVQTVGQGHVWTCVPVCVCMCACVFTFVAMCVHVYTHICVLICVHACSHICVCSCL